MCGNSFGRPCKGAALHLVDGRVAAGDIVLSHAVDLGDAREVLTHVVLGLHGDDLLKVYQRLARQTAELVCASRLHV